MHLTHDPIARMLSVGRCTIQTSEAAFACLKGLNLRFAIVRCYESLGRVDPSCAPSVAAAHAGGVDSVHAYMFPCPKCGNGGEQVN